MDIDKATLYDLGVFSRHDQDSLLNRLNFARTSGGKEVLTILFQQPFDNELQIKNTQEVLKNIINHLPHFPETITNGTMMVLDKYYESPIGSIPHPSGVINSFFYKLLNRGDYNTLKYSVKHIVTFLKGMKELLALSIDENLAKPLNDVLTAVRLQLEKPFFQKITNLSADYILRVQENIEAGYFFYQHKNSIHLLENLFYKIDAWYSMARATHTLNFHFPEVMECNVPILVAENLCHPLLEQPVGYNFSLSEKENFLFLTGANMAGKSTFIRAIGLSVYLASLGMGVPANKMRMSCFDGILSNIEISDNTLKGESYFFNEVQRIKTTVSKINNGKKWLILIDELFKGTNIQDAMKCSTAVIEGFRKVHTSLFILSTHLYEIGEGLQKYANLQFRYFETEAVGDSLIFSYQLKEGISNDRLGYLILRREKVVDMLDRL